MVWLRVLVMCLLTLALPAQGLAAATMVFCQTGSMPPSSAAPSAPAEVMAVHGDDCPGQRSRVDTQQAKTSCSVCAAACAMALPVSPPAMSEAEAAPVAFRAPLLPVAPDVAAGRDRPPRLLHA